MATKLMFVVVAIIGGLCSFSSAGVVPAVPIAAAAYVAPYASSYNAHVVNHAIAAPVAVGHVPAAPLVAAPAVPAISAHYALPHAHAYAHTHAHAHAAPFYYSEPLVVAK